MKIDCLAVDSRSNCVDPAIGADLNHMVLEYLETVRRRGLEDGRPDQHTATLASRTGQPRRSGSRSLYSLIDESKSIALCEGNTTRVGSTSLEPNGSMRPIVSDAASAEAGRAK